MDTNNKYLDTNGLSYFVSHLNGLIVRQDQEITSPEFANENNVIVLWGSGSRTKCVAPSEIDHNTKLVYIGTGDGAYYENPDDIEYGSDTEMTVCFGDNHEYILVRTRSSSTSAWPTTFNTVNSVTIWNEQAKRTNVQVSWVTPSGLETLCSASNVQGDPTKGTLSPSNTIGTNGYKPVYGYQ